MLEAVQQSSSDLLVGAAVLNSGTSVWLLVLLKDIQKRLRTLEEGHMHFNGGKEKK